jgi:hypothetical protein
VGGFRRNGLDACVLYARAEIDPLADASGEIVEFVMGAKENWDIRRSVPSGFNPRSGRSDTMAPTYR